ncbi:MAG TPA: DUF58 domain-containing protein, partial [Jatrophihabitantaceae bacterium]|nr:DUF58 domain-containing protein [Jatrophihabitantaceae bacterium]
MAFIGLVLSPLPATALLGYAALLLVAVGSDLLLAARISDLRLWREPSPSIRLGSGTETVLVISNAGRRGLRGRIRDAWLPSAGVQPREHPLRVPPGERRRVVSTLTPTRRGARRSAQVTIRTYGPLGLAARQRRFAVPGTLRVLPPFTSRKFLPEKISRLRQLDGAVLVRRRGQGAEFDSLREYVTGDDVRSIDW